MRPFDPAESARNLHHPASLKLVWWLAELEARQVGAPAIEPAHLLLGLCKSVDIDLPAIVPAESPDRDEVLEELLREVRRLRSTFRAAGLDARIFRRALRSCIAGIRVAPPESEFLHRSQAAKQVFADAGQFAGVADGVVYPVHLLHAVLSATDVVRDGLLNELGVNPACLKKAARQEVMPPCIARNPAAGLN